MPVILGIVPAEKGKCALSEVPVNILRRSPFFAFPHYDNVLFYQIPFKLSCLSHETLDRIFVILPNGEATPLQLSYWHFQPVKIPPGSTIVVPKDPSPFDAMGLTIDVTKIFSQIAVSLAALEAIKE